MSLTSEPTPPPSAQLKRPRTEMATPLPKIDMDLYGVLVAHRSLGREADPKYGDSERLAVVGKRVLALLVADTLSKKKPILEAAELETQIEGKFSSEDMDAFVETHGLRSRTITSANVNLTDPQETQLIFHSWIGAVYLQYGFGGVASWVGPSVDPSFVNEESNKRLRFDAPGPAPPPTAPPPLPQQPSQYPTAGQIDLLPPPPAPPQNGNLNPQQAGWLPQFNQLLAQRHMKVEYIPTMSGPSHQPVWTIDCQVNGISKGVGRGTSKAIAKESAAQAAYQNMGWGV